MLKIILSLVLLAVNLLQFKQIEKFLIEIGISWTFSKIVPYAILVVIGAILFKSLFSKIKIGSLKYILKFLVFVLPFGLGFALHPIYEGDFSKNGTKSVLNKEIKEFKNSDLIILTIPGCPFCHESTFNSNLMLNRNPNLKITYIVCNSNKNEIEPYRKKLNKKISVILAENPNEMAKIANGRFPTFILLNKNKEMMLWSNDQFGVGAKDLVESTLEK